VSDIGAQKRAAAAAALEEVRDGQVLGLGTGSTVAHFLELLGQRIEEGSLSDVVGVPTSVRTASVAHSRGIPVATLADHPKLDLAVDGADEVDPSLDLVKGMGGALLREKIVAQAARRFVVIVDEGKLVERLGTRSPLPVEVVPFGWTASRRFLEEWAGEVTRREDEEGDPYLTDNGNYVLDCRFPEGIPDAVTLDRRLQDRAGVVETGLFVDMADTVLVGEADGGVRVLRREEAP